MNTSDNAVVVFIIGHLAVGDVNGQQQRDESTDATSSRECERLIPCQRFIISCTTTTNEEEQHFDDLVAMR